MAKIRVPVRTPHIDMTPMVDVFALLLTFFMLTSTFRIADPASINTPSSISEKQAADFNLITILISKDNKIYFNVDNGEDTTKMFRAKILQEIGTRYNIEFKKEELDRFSKLASFGFPVEYLKPWINAKDQTERDKIQEELKDKNLDGIPIDSANNQLAYWVHFTRLINPDVQVAIKGDAEADYAVVKKILDLLQDKQVNKFNLTTNLEKVEVKLEE